MVPRLRHHRRFLPYPSQFFIHQTFDHPWLYSLDIDNLTKVSHKEKYRRTYPVDISLSGGSRPVLGPSQLTTHLQLVPRSRKRGPIHSLPHTPSLHIAYLVKHRHSFIFLPLPNGPHSPPTSAEVKKMWSDTFTPPYPFIAYCLLS
jgi:hypothetical protein